MREWADFRTETGEGGSTTIALTGPLTVSSIGVVDRHLREFAQPVGKVDLSGVTDIDTVGAWTAWRVARDNDAEIVGASEQAKRLIAAVSQSKGEGDVAPPRADGDDDLHPFEKFPPLVVASVIWAWEHGSLPEGYARTLNYLSPRDRRRWGLDD